MFGKNTLFTEGGKLIEMKLSRKKAIELCIELWEWLAKTGKRKENWPEWKKYGDILNDCWFCVYVIQHKKGCNYCPLHCFEGCFGTYYGKWDIAKTPRTRKKYAKLFLKQIKSTQRKK